MIRRVSISYIKATPTIALGLSFIDLIRSINLLTRLMEILRTSDTPQIVINESLSLIEINGRSCPENGEMFYEYIIAQVSKFNPKGRFVRVKFELEYADSVSYKWLFRICKQMVLFKSMGYDIKVSWYYAEGDDDMRIIGEEFSLLSGLTFTYIKFKVGEINSYRLISG